MTRNESGKRGMHSEMYFDGRFDVGQVYSNRTEINHCNNVINYFSIMNYSCIFLYVTVINYFVSVNLNTA